MLRHDPQQAGGLSGAPVREMANRALAHLARQATPNLVLMGVGGIMSAQDVYDKIALGAHLCQVYTGWIYGGPDFASRLLTDLLHLLDRNGIPTLTALRGQAL